MRKLRELVNGRSGGERKRGTAMLTAVFAMVALIGVGALAVDAGLLWSSRTQLQGVADGAALAAALNMIDKTTPAVTIPLAENAAVDVASKNFAGSTASVGVDPAEMEFGDWDLDARTLDTSVDLTDPTNVTGVRVVAHLDQNINRPVPAFLSRVLGKKEFNVTTDAIAYLGFAGRFGPGALDLPIGIDCCKIAGPDCEDSYCDTITNNPPNYGDYAQDDKGNGNPCYIADDPAKPASCLDFYATGNQIACWTPIQDDSPSVSTPDLIDIVEDGNPLEVSAGEYSYIDNGVKTPVIDTIADKFYGEGKWSGGNGAGKDTNGDGILEWVVALPVIECQTGDHCAKGDPDEIVGAVCFEINEIIVTPDKRIKGKFLCKEDVNFKDCDLGTTGTGGSDFDIRADLPVLVY